MTERMLPIVADLAVRAGRRVMELRQSPLVKQRKPDRSIVTNADHAANDILRQGLRAAFPDHAILSEETGFEGPTGARFLWLVDPLDGTRAYARGDAGFSVMLGLLDGGKPVLGVVYDPSEESLYQAAAGHGATLNGRPIRVSDRSAPVAVVSPGFPDKLKPVFPGPWLAPVNSVGVKIGLVARGEADVYIGHHPVHLWDTAGPQAILEEAGGLITLWDGSPLRYDLNRTSHPAPTLAAGAAFHGAAVEALAAFR